MSSLRPSPPSRPLALVLSALSLALFAASILLLPTTDATVPNTGPGANSHRAPAPKKGATTPEPQHATKATQTDKDEANKPSFTPPPPPPPPPTPKVNPPRPNDDLERLPFCPPPSEDPQSARNSNVLIVSTLDGRLTALDPRDGGKEVWSVMTEPGQMLSSTISQLELTSNAKWVKLIPSLAGGLYKFDGETIEAVPLNAETLLKTSFKFADNTIITGGKEIRSYGIEMDTGKVRYECTMEGGCQPSSGSDDSMDDVLVVQRETQTVRAIEPRTGNEKWNFSVSQHSVELSSGLEDLCGSNNDDDDTEQQQQESAEQFKAVVSDGVICSVDRAAPDIIRWKHHFEHPIVHAWQLVRGKLVKVDLFSHGAIPQKMPNLDAESSADNDSPLLYIGRHQNQLYIQESQRLEDSRINFPAVMGGGDDGGTTAFTNEFPRVSWRPYLISSHQRTPIINHGSKERDKELPLLAYDDKTRDNTALAVFSGTGYPYDSGMYLYPDNPDLAYDPVLDYQREFGSSRDVEESATFPPPAATDAATISPTLPPADNSDEGEVIEVMVSLWYWWKEVAFISIITAALMNFLIHRPNVGNFLLSVYEWGMGILGRRRQVQVALEEIPVRVPVQVPMMLQHQNELKDQQRQQQQQPLIQGPPSRAADTGFGLGPSNNTISAAGGSSGDVAGGGNNSGSRQFLWSSSAESGLGSGAEFSSRYLVDFEPVRCLGKGGFGVVFESKNKLDDNRYAVKRIRLPQNESAKRKVMREVKCLAKLDHRNIVRYYNAWVERPPPGWQEQQDEWWKSYLAGTGLAATGLTSTSFTSEDPRLAGVGATSTGVGGGDTSAATESLAARGTFALPPRREDNGGDSFSIVFEKATGDGGAGGDSSFDFSASPASKTSSSSSSDCREAIDWDNSDRRKNQKKKELEELKKPVVQQHTYLYIVMQLCQQESLKDWLKRRPSCGADLPRQRRPLRLFHDICRGVEYVHAQGLIHRDLKPGNIFFSADDGSVKIGDFGLVTEGGRQEAEDEDSSSSPTSTPLRHSSSLTRGQHTDQVGTELYMSPEQLARRSYDRKVDVYSLGLILFELLVPFGTQMERLKILSDLRNLRFPDDFTSREEFDLVRSMLLHKPSERPEAAEVLNTEFMQSVMEEMSLEATGEGGAGDSGGGDNDSGAGGGFPGLRRKRNNTSGSSMGSSFEIT